MSAGTGNYVSVHSRITEAIPLLERTLADAERVLGPDHPDTVAFRDNMRRAYRDSEHKADKPPRRGS